MIPLSLTLTTPLRSRGLATLPGLLLGLLLVSAASAQSDRPGDTALPREGATHPAGEATAAATEFVAQAVWVAPAGFVFDGDPSEWAFGEADVVLASSAQLVELGDEDPESAWSGPLDASVEMWVGWNETDLFVGGRVRDDVVQHNLQTWFRGDSLELFLNAEDRVETWGPDDYQVMLAPTFAERPWGVYSRSGQAGSGASDGGFGGVEVAAFAGAGGYTFEARIPWHNFGQHDVQAGMQFGFNLALCDRDAGEGLETYLTWTGEAQIAQYADRRGTLLLSAPLAPGASVVVEAQEPSMWRAWMPLGLVLLYSVALATRRVWRARRARLSGAAAAVVAIAFTIGFVVLLRMRERSELEAVTADLERHATSFAELVSSGALGHPEPAELVRRARALVSGETITREELSDFVAFGPPQVAAAEAAEESEAASASDAESGQELAPGPRLVLGARHKTRERGIPYRPFVTAGNPAAEAAHLGLVLDPGDRRHLRLAAAREADGLHLVLRVRDERWLSVADRPIPILRVQAFAAGEPVGPPITVRHRRHLWLDEEEFVVQAGVEIALIESGGRSGRLAATGLLLDLEGRTPVDELAVENLAATSTYAVEVVAASARVPSLRPEPPGLRVEPGGAIAWAGWREDIVCALRPLSSGSTGVVAPTSGPSPSAPVAEHALRAGEAPAESVRVERELGLGAEPLFALTMRSRDAVVRGRSPWEVLPFGVAAALIPFLVAMAAEALAASRRIRWKLAVGFAVSSLVPLAALTFLLEATLSQERAVHERQRSEELVAGAERDIEADLAELEARAALLVELAELRALNAAGREAGEEPLFPRTSAELDRWWGTRAPDEVRFLERADATGRLSRIGSGPGWQSLPRLAEPRTGLVRLWGRLYAVGVAHSQSSVEFPLSSIVLRPPRIPTAADEGLRVFGAGRDPAPSPEDLEPVAGGGAVRHAVRGPTGELALVLAAEPAERGEPFLGNWSLTELLVAAGLTAVFTATLFAVILTSHIVPPIERLDRALRDGLPHEIPSAVPDEVGHLTQAIQAFAGELAARVDQLESLQVAQSEMSGRLDAELARRAVLAFFEERTGARAWLAWAGDASTQPALYGVDGTEVARPAGSTEAQTAGSGFLPLARAAGEVLQVVAQRTVEPREPRAAPWPRPAESPPASALGLTGFEAEVFGAARRLLALPLVAGGECRGAIVLAFATLDEPSELDFLGAVASQAAIVLENAHLYHLAVNDPATGFLSEPGFQQRVTEEIQRARGTPAAGVTIVQVRLPKLPKDDTLASERLAEAGRRMRRAVRGLALFGRSGSADLRVAFPWQGGVPDADVLAGRIADAIGAAAWPDGDRVAELATAAASWPKDGPSARFLFALLEERLVAVEPRGKEPSAAQRALPEDLVAESPLFLDLLDSLRRVAAQEVTLLVTGETGVGKDKIAELCHRWSPRSTGPLVHIHCPSLPAELIEDELFGHEVGAFTGAQARRTSPFEFAAGGTIVLDEIGGLAPSGQVALLRVLENREVLPLGATRPVPLDVRIVVTTSLDLASEVEAGRFRGDLWYRLSAAQLTVPPLRLRRRAIPRLAEQAVSRFNLSADRPVTGVSPAVLDALYEYAWPGNLRELDNVLQRGLVLAAGGELGLGHLDLTPDVQALGGVSLSPRQREILAGLGLGETLTSAEVARRLEVSSRTALRDLQLLVEAGLLTREGAKRGTRFRRTERALLT